MLKPPHFPKAMGILAIANNTLPVRRPGLQYTGRISLHKVQRILCVLVGILSTNPLPFYRLGEYQDIAPIRVLQNQLRVSF